MCPPQISKDSCLNARLDYILLDYEVQTRNAYTNPAGAPTTVSLTLGIIFLSRNIAIVLEEKNFTLDLALWVSVVLQIALLQLWLHVVGLIEEAVETWRWKSQVLYDWNEVFLKAEVWFAIPIKH